MFSKFSTTGELSGQRTLHCTFWVLMNMTICIFYYCCLIDFKKEKRESGDWMIVYSCYEVITGANLVCRHSIALNYTVNGEKV